MTLEEAIQKQRKHEMGLSGFDPHFRIGQLEGAIKGALLHLESDNQCFEVLDKMWLKEYEERNRKIITSLKQLIGEKDYEVEHPLHKK
jgi:hypothetical protein